MTKSKRNSTLEILRIISMLLIIMHHYSVHGFELMNLPLALNKFIVGFLSLGGKLGVSCFILISGYYMIDSKFTLQKFLKLVGEIWFYSISMLILFLTVLNPVELNMKLIISSIFPLLSSFYWFMTAYVLLMILSPILNLIINNIGKCLHENLIIFSILIWSFLHNFLNFELYYNDFIWFIVLYFIAGYLKKYPKRKTKKHFLKAFISYLIIIISDILLIYIGSKYNINYLVEKSAHFSELNSPFILFSSIELFLGFSNSKPFNNKIVNNVASTTLGIYLIHDNRIMRPFLWNTIFNNSKMFFSNFLLLHSIFSVLIVFIFCMIIDLIRQNTIEKLYLKILNKFLIKIKLFLEKIILKIKNLFFANKLTNQN